MTAISYDEAEAAAALADLLLREVGVDENRLAGEVAKVRSELAPPPPSGPP